MGDKIIRLWPDFSKIAKHGFKEFFLMKRFSFCMLLSSLHISNPKTHKINLIWCKAKEKYRGVFEIQKSGDKTSSGEIGLDIRTHASPKVGQDQVNFSIPARSEQLSGSHANEIKHDHSPAAIVVLLFKTLFITCKDKSKQKSHTSVIFHSHFAWIRTKTLFYMLSRLSASKLLRMQRKHAIMNEFSGQI